MWKRLILICTLGSLAGILVISINPVSSKLLNLAFLACVVGAWFDASAKALGEGYRGYTIPLGPAGTIQEMNCDGLVPGDLAVTTSGVHILAYAGNGQWIQADPGIGAVATLDGKTGDNVWFHTPVTTHRWRILAQGNANSAQEAVPSGGGKPPH